MNDQCKEQDAECWQGSGEVEVITGWGNRKGFLVEEACEVVLKGPISGDGAEAGKRRSGRAWGQRAEELQLA